MTMMKEAFTAKTMKVSYNLFVRNCKKVSPDNILGEMFSNLSDVTRDAVSKYVKEVEYLPPDSKQYKYLRESVTVAISFLTNAIKNINSYDNGHEHLQDFLNLEVYAELALLLTDTRQDGHIPYTGHYMYKPFETIHTQLKGGGRLEVVINNTAKDFLELMTVGCPHEDNLEYVYDAKQAVEDNINKSVDKDAMTLENLQSLLHALHGSLTDYISYSDSLSEELDQGLVKEAEELLLRLVLDICEELVDVDL